MVSYYDQYPNGSEAIPVTNLKGFVTYSVSSPSDILVIVVRFAEAYEYRYEGNWGTNGFAVRKGNNIYVGVKSSTATTFNETAWALTQQLHRN